MRRDVSPCERLWLAETRYVGACSCVGIWSFLTRIADNSGTVLLVGTGQEAGPDEDDFHTFRRKKAEVEKEENLHLKAKQKFKSQMGSILASKATLPVQIAAPKITKKVVFF